MKSPHFILSVSLLLAARGLRAGEAAPADHRIGITAEFIGQLLAEAQGRNPALEAASARADAASEAVGSVRIWEDPTFTFGLWRSGSHGFSSTEEGNIIYGLEQKLPVFGRPELARHVAEAAAAMERLNVGYETEKLRRDLTTALLELALADRRIELAQEDLSWLEANVATVDNRYKVGKSSQVEWLKIQTGRAKAADLLRTLILLREHQQVQINRLLNRDMDAPWPTIELPGVAGAVTYDDRLVNAALDFAPKLRVMREETAQSEAAAELTKRQRMPEVGVGVQARQYSGDGGIREGTMTVSLSLPWLNRGRYDSDFRRDKARMRATERDAQDYALGIREEVHHLTVELDSARRQALLYRDEIIPLTEQTLSSAHAAWEGNLGPLQDILEAHLMLVDNRLVLAQSVAEQGRKLAELTLLTGTNDFASHATGNAPGGTP